MPEKGRFSGREARRIDQRFLYAGYANWLGCLLGAATGAGRMTPVAAAGLEGTPVAETMVAFLLISVGLVSLVAAGLSLWGLRGNNLSAT